MPALREYQLAWPSVTLDFSSGFGFEPLPALLAGELDLVITSDIQLDLKSTTSLYSTLKCV